MALKTFNIDAEAYKKFSEYCRKEGLSMSKKIENFIKNEMEKIMNINTNTKQPKNMKNAKSFEDTKNAESLNLAKNQEHPLKKYC